MPAEVITTNRSKRSVSDAVTNIGTKPSQFERAQRIEMERTARWSDSDKLRIDARANVAKIVHRNHASVVQERTHYNRDINAARNITNLGLWRFGQYIDPSLPAIENTAFSRTAVNDRP